MLSLIPPERRPFVAQLLRFLVSGAAVTALGVGVYALVAVALRWHPQLGNFLAYAVAVATGYVLHSRWSFRDHGGERLLEGGDGCVTLACQGEADGAQLEDDPVLA